MAAYVNVLSSLYACFSYETGCRILMKSGMDVMPLEATQIKKF
jgi:hypothetical protein